MWVDDKSEFVEGVEDFWIIILPKKLNSTSSIFHYHLPPSTKKNEFEIIEVKGKKSQKRE